MTITWALRATLLACLLALAGAPAAAQTMPDPREMSGIPLPSRDLPAGTVAVRVIRGTFANNVSGVPVGPRTRVGFRRVIGVPSPSWPTWFVPQQ